MRTWILWTTKLVAEADLRHFASAEGGYWNDVVGDEAVVERGSARVFMSAARVDDEENVMRDDVTRAEAQMRALPAGVVFMRIGHAPGSTDLAEELSARAISKWGGFIDRNEA